MTLRDIALQYHAWGANVTAIGGAPDLKRPAHRWQQFTTTRQTVSAVRAMGGVRLPDRTIGSGPNAGKAFTATNPDHTCALLEFASGVHGRLTASFFAVKSAQAGIEVHGTEGSLRLDSVVAFNSKLELCRPGKREWEPVSLTGEPYAGVEWARGPLELGAAIREGKRLTCPGEAAYHTLDITLAALEASESGKTVSVASRFAPK